MAQEAQTENHGCSAHASLIAIAADAAAAALVFVFRQGLDSIAANAG